MNEFRVYLNNIEPGLLHHVRGKMRTLIDLIQDNKFLSEEALLREICGENHERKYYHNLKSRTLKMLQALALASSPKGGEEIKKKLDLCQKNFVLGQKFCVRGDKSEGIRLLKQAHRISVEFDFVHIACETSSLLYHNQVYYQSTGKQKHSYAEQVAYYLDRYAKEKKVEHCFYRFISIMSCSENKKALKSLVDEAITFPNGSIRCENIKSMLQILYGFVIRDYMGIVKVAEQVLCFFEGKKGVYLSHFHFFYVNRGVALMAMGMHIKAEESFIAAIPYANKKSLNEYIIALYRTVNALHAGQYELAYELYLQNRKCRFEQIRQQFAIIQAYLCFLSHMGYLQLEGKFRLGKYLNETFKSQSDKQGANITILIAELLVHLARDRGRFIDRVEAINNYSYRHLKSPDTMRAKRFIKILCLLPRANFHPVALKRVAARQIQYLEEHPIHMGENVSIEIIPFGDLLDMIMKDLAGKKAVG